MKRGYWYRISAVSGFFAVALGAFGAHALRETLARAQAEETWRTAVLYHLVHTLAILATAGLGRGWRRPSIWFLSGIIVFCGSLYLLSLTGIRWLGAVTPLGGFCFLAGWISLFLAGRDTDAS